MNIIKTNKTFQPYHDKKDPLDQYWNLDNDICTKYKISDIENPDGWNIQELEMLKEIGFNFLENENDFESGEMNENTTDMYLQEEEVGINDQVKNKKMFVYKCDEGFVVLNEKRRHVFENFDNMLEYIECQ